MIREGNDIRDYPKILYRKISCIRYVVHGHEPLDERELRMLEDGADQDGEVLSATCAAEQPVRTAEATVLSAIRTDIVPVGTTLTDEEFLAVPVVLEGGVRESMLVNLSKPYVG